METVAGEVIGDSVEDGCADGAEVGGGGVREGDMLRAIAVVSEERWKADCRLRFRTCCCCCCCCCCC